MEDNLEKTHEQGQTDNDRVHGNLKGNVSFGSGTSMDSLPALTGVNQRDLKNTVSMDEENEVPAVAAAQEEQKLSHMSTYNDPQGNSDREQRTINNVLDAAPSAATST